MSGSYRRTAHAQASAGGFGGGDHAGARAELKPPFLDHGVAGAHRNARPMAAGEQAVRGIIDTDTLHRWLSGGHALVLIDTLPASAFEKGHLPGAINIVSDDICARVRDVVPDLEARIVVYCGGPRCKRASLAAARLESLGYTRVHHYVEGKVGWRAAGHALHAGTPPPRGEDDGAGP
ncbi:MAG: rhodanese-like domain-containing protein [Alphaproteobacteria bacterium]|nr:MAG: rhodanese-like domain-containing protein [Alphaproteobacteria bacterium]